MSRLAAAGSVVLAIGFGYFAAHSAFAAAINGDLVYAAFAAIFLTLSLGVLLYVWWPRRQPRAEAEAKLSTGLLEQPCTCQEDWCVCVESVWVPWAVLDAQRREVLTIGTWPCNACMAGRHTLGSA